MAAKVDSQVARLREPDDSDDDGEEPAESEGSTDSDDEPQFFVMHIGRCSLPEGVGTNAGCAITARE